MEEIGEFVTRSSRWRAFLHRRDYMTDWRAHPGGRAPLEAAPFAVCRLTRADLGAARCGLLAREDPAGGMAASPFWIDG